MATPLNADQLLRALRSKGLRVVEHRSWRTHNRNDKGPWGPAHGVMLHHTVTTGTASSVELCYNGHTSLPGPLCHGVIDKDGTVYLVGNGRTNHAGSGDGDVLRAVINETTLPPDNEADTDGNRRFYGFEAINLGNGKDPWPAAQLDAMALAAAALCEAHDWSEQSVLAHAEWQPGKIDPLGPGYPGHDGMRALVRNAMEGDDTMPTANEIADAVLNRDAIPAARPPYENSDYATNKTWPLKYAIQTNTEAGRQTLDIVRDLRDRMGTLEHTGMTPEQLQAVAAEVTRTLVPALLDALAGRLQS